MFETFTELIAGSPWTYAIVLAVAGLDVVLPILPSEAAVLSAGALASAGELSLGIVIAAGALGALAGDNSAYSLGRLLGRRLEPRLATSGRAAGRRAWAERRLRSQGMTTLFIARFVPFGRTAATVTAGLLPIRWTRFLLLSASAATLWASLVGLAGYLGGRTIEEQPYLLAALVIALGAAYLMLRVLRRSSS
jgi:membrane protein DedA with SNARE-associated domain